MTVGIGIIGTGMMGRTYSAGITRQAKHARLVAVAGGRRSEQLGAEFNVPAELAVDALLARNDVDAVVIATPHTSHLPLALEAAAAGKHVYLEKPMALNVEECDRIIAACNAAGVKLAVASQARYNDISIRAKQLIDDGTIGPIRFFRVTSPTVGWDVPADGWFVDPKEGGAYLDWGPHGCDTLRWLTDSDATLAFGMFDNFGGISALDPSAMVSYRLGSGAMAQFWMSYEIPSPGLGSYMQWLLVGENGMLDFDRDHLRVGKGDSWEQVMELPAWNWLVDPMADRRLAMTSRQVDQFARALGTGASLDITGEDGLAAIEMVEAAIRSARTGQSVAIPLDRAETPS